MLALTENQRGFVTAIIELNDQDQTKAAMIAGFGGSPESAAVAASRMMRNPMVLAAIREEADKRLRSGAILGASRLIEIAKDVKHKDSFKASIELLNRSGLLVEQTHRVIHEDNRTDAELERAVVTMATKFGIDPKKLLGHAVASTPVVDAEFEAVPSAEGLEDLL